MIELARGADSIARCWTRQWRSP